MRALLRSLGRRIGSGKTRSAAEPRGFEPASRDQTEKWRAQAIGAKLGALRADPGLLDQLLASERRSISGQLAACGERAAGNRQAPPVHQEHYVSFVEEKRLGGVPLAIPYTDRWEKYSLDRRLVNADDFPLDQMPLRRLFAAGGSFIDIGAHIGLPAVAHGLLGDFNRIHAIEPTLQNFDCLKANIAWNGLEQVVECHRLAIGEDDRTIRMRVKGGSGRHFVLQQNSKNDPRPNEEVRQVSLDSFLRELGPEAAKVTYVKSDTQGFEGRVLMGAEGFLAKRQAIWEITYVPYTLHRRSRIELDAFYAMIAANFATFLICEGSGVDLLPIDRLDQRLSRDKGVYMDLILFP